VNLGQQTQLLLPYQLKYLYSLDRYTLVEKSVRVGITWVHSMKSVLRRLNLIPGVKQGAKPLDEYFLSATHNTAKEYIRYCRDWADTFNAMLGSKVVDTKDWTAEVAYFPNGSRITALSSSPKGLVGLQGDITLDEFAFHDEAERIYSAAQTRMLRRQDAQLTLISSHNGYETIFFRLCYDANNGRGVFKNHRITIFDAVEQGLAEQIWREKINEYPDLETLRKAFIQSIRDSCLSDEQFRQDYCCEPAKSGTLISPDEYDACAILENVPERLDHSRNYNDLYLGVDTGRSKDLTSVVTLERGVDPKAPAYLSNVYRMAQHFTMHDTKFPVQEAAVRDVAQHRCIAGGFIDLGSVGRGLADAIQDETGSLVEGFAFTAPRKAQMAERLRQFVQQQRIAFPKNDPKFRADILSMRKVQMPGGQWKYEGQSGDSHADRFWSASLALEAAESKNGMTLATVESYQPKQLPAPVAVLN
jgi:phage FluMu gp28-like protein